MNDIEALGLVVQNYSQLESKENNNDEMIEKIEKINQHHDNYQKYHTCKPIVTEKDYNKDLQYYIVSHHFGQLDWMGYGYTKQTFITARDYDDVVNYCEDRFGENNCQIYYNIQHSNYVIKKVNIKEYLIEINKILNKIKEYENLPCVNINWKTIGYKICVSNGIPLQMKNGKMEYEGKGEMTYFYSPKPLDEIRL